MDVVVWLRSLDLGKYEALFRENDIDETVLPRTQASLYSTRCHSGLRADTGRKRPHSRRG